MSKRKKKRKFRRGMFRKRKLGRPAEGAFHCLGKISRKKKKTAARRAASLKKEECGPYNSATGRPLRVGGGGGGDDRRLPSKKKRKVVGKKKRSREKKGKRGGLRDGDTSYREALVRGTTRSWCSNERKKIKESGKSFR